MNFAGNIVGIALPVAIGLIVSAKGSYYLALMVFAATGAGSVPRGIAFGIPGSPN
jgi:ACS family D-galactonate transporter-like MFS transporter